MANEITGSVSLAIGSGSRRAFTGVYFGLTLTSPDIVLQDQTIGTGAEALDFGDVVPTFVAIINQDATNYVDVGLDSGASTKVFARLKAGNFALWFPYTPADPIYAKANTSPCKCAILGIKGATLGTCTYHATPFISGSYNSTAYFTLSGSSGVRGVSMTATHAWNAIGTTGTDELIPFCYAEVTGGDVVPPAAITVSNIGGYLMDSNPGTIIANWLSLQTDASDKVAQLPLGGGFAIMPVKSGGNLYCGGSDTPHVPLYVTY